MHCQDSDDPPPPDKAELYSKAFERLRKKLPVQCTCYATIIIAVLSNPLLIVEAVIFRSNAEIVWALAPVCPPHPQALTLPVLLAPRQR